MQERTEPTGSHVTDTRRYHHQDTAPVTPEAQLARRPAFERPVAMRRSARRRAILILGFIALLFGLAVWYGSLGPAPALGAYPDEDELATDYNRYLGEQVTVGGRVVDTDPITIRTDPDTGPPLQLTVTDLSISVREGEQLRVYGVVEADHTIHAIDAIAVPPSGHWYAYTVSFLAGLWVLVRLFRYWRLDLRTWTLTPRRVPLAPLLVDWLRTRLRRDADA